MEAMPQFMRQGHDLVERAIEIRHDAAFLNSIQSHTERSTPFSRALLRVDPVLFKSASGKFSQFRRETAELFHDQIAGFVKRVFLVNFTDRGKQTPPGEFLKAENACLGLEVAPEHWQGVINCPQHRFKRAAVNPCHIQRGMQAVLPTALAVQSHHFPLDAVKTGSQWFLHFFKYLLFALVGALAHDRIRMRTQVDQRRQRQRLHFAIQFEVNALLRGQHALQVIPGASARKSQLVGKDFFWFRHLITAFPGYFQQAEGMVVRCSGDFQCFFEAISECAQPGTDPHA